MKFLVDMALSPELALWLRTEGHDAVHASELSLDRAPDTQILSVSVDQDRVIITADLDFPRLLTLMGASRPGLILLRGGNFNEAESVERVRRVLAAIPADDLPKCIVVVDRERSGAAGFPSKVTRASNCCSWQGKGLGAGLLKDAMQRTLLAADIARIRAFAVHAKDDEARAFYEHFDFSPLPSDPYHLFRLLKDIRTGRKS